VHDLDKVEMIGRLLQADDAGLTIVFTKTKRQAQRVADELHERGFPSSPLHGDMAQGAREKALKQFREGKVRVLVATDVAARGIDVADVTHVVNYTCPEDDAIYVHRIGRTGRAGATGIAITFVDWADVTRWKVINKTLGLPFDELVETYSTSENFFHDQGIPHGTKGRLVPEGTITRSTPKDKREGSSDRSGGRSRGRTSGRDGGRDTGRDSGRDTGRDTGRAKENSGSTQKTPQTTTQKSGESATERPARDRNRTRSRGGRATTKAERPASE
jgi:superfamily II DNA/RNA helicase